MTNGRQPCRVPPHGVQTRAAAADPAGQAERWRVERAEFGLVVANPITMTHVAQPLVCPF